MHPKSSYYLLEATAMGASLRKRVMPSLVRMLGTTTCQCHAVGVFHGLRITAVAQASMFVCPATKRILIIWCRR